MYLGHHRLSIFFSTFYLTRESLKPKTCPGVPAGPPPALSEYDDEKEDDEEGREEGRRGKKIRFDDEDSGGQSFKAPGEEDVVAPGEETGPQVDEIQKKMLLMAGQDVNQYMKQVLYICDFITVGSYYILSCF